MLKPAPGMIVVGKLGAPHGVRGQLRLKSYTGDPLAIGSYGPLSLAGGRKLTVSQARLLREDMLVVTLSGVASREQADELSGQELFVSRQALPPASEDEFYHADLIGLAAQAVDGEVIGRVKAIHNFGAGDILEVAVLHGEAMLLPFTKAIVPAIDFGAGRLTLVPPGEIEVPETRDTM